MARPKNPNRDKAKKIWLNDKDIKLKDLADQLGETSNTIRKWKSQDKWEEDAPVEKKAARKKSSPKKSGAPLGNKNALNNQGGAPKGNQNAVTHGFFAKFMPEETLEIMEEIKERSPTDMLWDQITLQYTAIIRAQRIMYVKDQDDLTRELKKEKSEISHDIDKDGNNISLPTYIEHEYELQFAWDKHATFLNAQSRAMSTLSNLIKQFTSIAHENDEHRLKLQQMVLNIDKTKAEVETLKKDAGPSDQVVILRDINRVKELMKNDNNRSD
ncbi:phage terminase small subunit [Priestia aryabhattai]|uniref:phage terminase small subunit n=1 Tax=Priestia aryabhattai TaxID=412384 RepID=UPI00398F0E9A